MTHATPSNPDEYGKRKAWFTRSNRLPRGTRKYLEENAAAANIKLTGAEIQELKAAIPLNEIIGDRYSAGGLNAINC
jgi:hypothetical protein